MRKGLRIKWDHRTPSDERTADNLWIRLTSFLIVYLCSELNVSVPMSPNLWSSSAAYFLRRRADLQLGLEPYRRSERSLKGLHRNVQCELNVHCSLYTNHNLYNVYINVYMYNIVLGNLILPYRFFPLRAWWTACCAMALTNCLWTKDPLCSLKQKIDANRCNFQTAELRGKKNWKHVGKKARRNTIFSHSKLPIPGRCWNLCFQVPHHPRKLSLLSQGPRSSSKSSFAKAQPGHQPRCKVGIPIAKLGSWFG